MLLIIGDVHSQFHVINQQITFAEEKLGRPVDAVIVLGDMGIYENKLKGFFHKESKRFLRPVFFLDGNHEDYARFSSLVSSYGEFMTYLPRGHVTRIGKYRFLSLGGACYLDALNSPSGSEIKDRDIEKCLEHKPGEIDIIVSHDCPLGIGVPNTPGLEFYGEPGFARSQELIKWFKPQKWFFGHHHMWFYRKIDESEYYGLPESWKGFGLLNDQMEFETVKNNVERQETWFQSLYRRLFGM